jgi:Pentapeptide repeats (8 copies)
VGKYDQLRDYLADQTGHEVQMSFTHVERLVGALPASARSRGVWWTNESTIHARTLHAVGWRVHSVSQAAESVVFVRASKGESVGLALSNQDVVLPRSGRSRKTRETKRMGHGDNAQAASTRPALNDSAGWVRYWTNTGQPWRKRPEITRPRETVLLDKMKIKSDALAGVYPFEGFRLHREDVEWLIARFDDEGSRIDLRGSDLSNEDLSDLPLSNLLAGVSGADWRRVDQGAGDEDQRETLFRAAAVNLRKCDLTNADLRNASLTYADLRGAKLSDCNLEGADLFRADFGGEFPANLHGAILNHATRLNEVKFASRAGVAPRLFDVQWDGASLSGVNWLAVKKVADEKRSYHKARRRDGDTWSVHNRRRVIWYSEASQTYRQLSMALRSQGMNDQARRFTYRAEVSRFWSLFHSLTGVRYWGPFGFSFLLGAISGWGYRLYRSAILYTATILVFADLYRVTSGNKYDWRQAIVLSVIGFHGRAFYPSDNYGFGTTFAAVGAAEAFVGVFIEAIVIATFTRRLFSD